MEKNNNMRKSNLLKGAFITALGIFIAKIIGVLYVIPFHSVIGDIGGSLYGYAYSVYVLFVSISSAGLPLAISKIVSEYQTLGYYSIKKRVFLLGKRVALLLGFISFIILLIFAPILSKIILGNLNGSISINDVSLLIRIISIGLLIVPVLSVYRGYFEGHRFMDAPSISQVLEQIVKVLVILVGSFLVLNIFKLSLTSAVGVAVFATAVGSFSSYIYLASKYFHNKKKFNERIITANEPIVTDKQILQKVFIYALPFVVADIFMALYNFTDAVTVVKALVVKAKYSISDAESIYGMISVWGNKFNMILSAISSGIIVSLIPNLTQSFTRNDNKDINKKINQTFNGLFFVAIPITIGLSFLAKPVWYLFYGVSDYGPSVLSYLIFVGLFSALYTTTVMILQTLKDYKTVFISLLFGIVLKILLNTNLVVAFYNMGSPAYYGIITATIIGYVMSLIICLVQLRVKYRINYESILKNLLDILLACVLMIVVLFLMKLFIPFYSANRFLNLLIIIIYTIVGGFSYLIFLYKSGTIHTIFGHKIDKYMKKQSIR